MKSSTLGFLVRILLLRCGLFHSFCRNNFFLLGLWLWFRLRLLVVMFLVVLFGLRLVLLLSLRLWLLFNDLRLWLLLHLRLGWLLHLRLGWLLDRFGFVLFMGIDFWLLLQFGFLLIFDLVFGLFLGLRGDFLLLFLLSKYIFHRFWFIHLLNFGLSLFVAIFLGRLLLFWIDAVEFLLCLLRSFLVPLFGLLDRFSNFLFGFCCTFFADESNLCLLFIFLGLFLRVLRVLLFFLNLFELQVLLSGTGSFHRFYSVCELPELSHEEAIHVVHVWIDTLCKLQWGMEVLGSVVGQTGLADFEASLNKLHVAVLKSVINDPLILLDWDRACRVPL